MCGIFGILDLSADALRGAGAAFDRDALERTAGLLAHRGPDSRGIHVEPGLALVHTRLSLLDPNPRADQPMWDASGRFAIVYNGEAYDFRELRAELERDGATFRTTSDTEVVLEACARRGVDATLPRLEGMFAFALWDRIERRLVLARDRFGIKPLHVAEHQGRLLFASEIAALAPWLPFAPDQATISSYLMGFPSPTRGATFFRGVRIVEPGTLLVARPGEATETRTFAWVGDLWDADLARELRGLPETALVDRADDALTRSVASQLFADAPVGAYCSGGVDSSLIAAIAARQRPNLRIFHADVVGPLSERAAAERLARHLGLSLDVVAVEPQDFVDGIADVLAHYGFPFTGHPNSIPFLAVSRLVREHGVKGVLSGEGADECFLGYRWITPSWTKVLRELPGKAAARLRRAFGAKGAGAMQDDKRSAARIGDARDLVVALHNRFDRDLPYARIDTLVDGDAGDTGRRASGASVASGADLRNLKTLRHLSFHLRTLLHRNDCLGMAASVEARFPFLDTALVRLAVNLPYDAKLRFTPSVFDRKRPFFVDKWIVREVSKRYLPPELSRRPKQGFSVNAHKRMRIDDAFLDGSFVEEQFELPRDATRFLVRHADGDLKVRLLQLDAWADLFLKGMERGAVAEKLRRVVTVGGTGRGAKAKRAAASGGAETERGAVAASAESARTSS